MMLRPERVFKFWVSPDKKFVMLAIRPQKLFRHSFIAMYEIYNVATGERTPLQPSDPGNVPGFGDQGQGPQQGGGGRPRRPQQLPLMYATWSPSGHSLAYVFANNIYYRATPSSPDFPVTESGNTIVLILHRFSLYRFDVTQKSNVSSFSFFRCSWINIQWCL